MTVSDGNRASALDQYPGYFNEPDVGQTPEQAATAEATANRIVAPCGCFARPGEDEGTECMHGNLLAPWPAGVWPSTETP